MIRLGFTDDEKRAEIARYVRTHDVRQTVVLEPKRFTLAYDASPCERVEWAEIIMYRTYYPLIQQIDRSTLLVLNEPLRTQNRNDLTYNCIRNFLQQTAHQIVFSYLPAIDTVSDLGTLLDFDTRSRWKRDAPRRDMFADVDIAGRDMTPTFEAVDVPIDGKLRDAYAKKKRALFTELGGRDPHTLPRELHLVGGKAKAAVARGPLVGRNNRLGLANLVTYREASGEEPRTAFEFCHNAIDMADYLVTSRQARVPALVTPLPVDRWYMQRYTEWSERIRETYAMAGLA
jgi:hypothetical protein